MTQNETTSGLFFVWLVAAMIAYYWQQYLNEEAEFWNKAKPLEDVLTTTTNLETSVPVFAVLKAANFESINTITDPVYDVSTSGPALRLTRVVEYCQWRESSVSDTTKDGQKQKTRYIYTKNWYQYRIISELFNNPFLYSNPEQHIKSLVFARSELNYGDSLPYTQKENTGRVSKILVKQNLFGESTHDLLVHRHDKSGSHIYIPYQSSLPDLDQFKLAAAILRQDGWYLYAQIDGSCTVGDARISFKETKLRDVAVAAVLSQRHRDSVHGDFLLTPYFSTFGAQYDVAQTFEQHRANYYKQQLDSGRIGPLWFLALVSVVLIVGGLYI